MSEERIPRYMDFQKRSRPIFSFPNDIACAAGLGFDRVPTGARCNFFKTDSTVLVNGTCSGQCAIVARMNEINKDSSTA